jgi:hypothetical protein
MIKAAYRTLICERRIIGQSGRGVRSFIASQRRLLGWLALGAALAMLAPAHAQPTDPDAPVVTHFTTSRWSMIRPARDFEGGCVVGFLAFSFSDTGYFVFNNRVRGSWRIDELGNLKLRTRDGTQFTLLVDGETLRTYVNLPFIRRTDLFQRCPQ